MGGVGKKTKKNHARENAEKKIRAEKKVIFIIKVKKKNHQKEGPTPGPAILILIINKDI